MFSPEVFPFVSTKGYLLVWAKCVNLITTDYVAEMHCWTCSIFEEKPKDDTAMFS